MRALLLVLAVVASDSAHADGFGWYVYPVHWGSLRDEGERSLEETRDLLRIAPKNRDLATHLQREIDAGVWSRCDPRGGSSPMIINFYPVETLTYALNTQDKRGVSKTFFKSFVDPIVPYFSVATPPVDGGDPYVVLDPTAVEAAYAEVRDLNAKVSHPKEHNNHLKHLEGVLLAAAADRDESPFGRQQGDAVALLFCGHD